MSAPKRGTPEAAEALEGPCKRPKLEDPAAGRGGAEPGGGAPPLAPATEAAAHAAPPHAAPPVKDEPEAPPPPADTSAPDQEKLEPSAWGAGDVGAPAEAPAAQAAVQQQTGPEPACAGDAAAPAGGAAGDAAMEAAAAPAEDAAAAAADAAAPAEEADADAAPEERLQTQEELQSAATAALNRLLQPAPGASAPLPALSPGAAAGAGLPPPPPGARLLLPHAQALLQQLKTGAPAPRGTAPVALHAPAAAAVASGAVPGLPDLASPGGSADGGDADGDADADAAPAALAPPAHVPGSRSGSRARRPKPPPGSSAAQRLQRRKNTSPSTSSYKGVTRHRRTGRWEAHVSRMGRGRGAPGCRQGMGAPAAGRSAALSCRAHRQPRAPAPQIWDGASPAAGIDGFTSRPGGRGKQLYLGSYDTELDAAR
jgi:hypothetical protein